MAKQNEEKTGLLADNLIHPKPRRKKAKLTFEDTFFSTTGLNNEQILRHETLRRAGVGKLLVQMGRITEEELEGLTARFTE